MLRAKSSSFLSEKRQAAGVDEGEKQVVRRRPLRLAELERSRAEICGGPSGTAHERLAIDGDDDGHRNDGRLLLTPILDRSPPHRSRCAPPGRLVAALPWLSG